MTKAKGQRTITSNPGWASSGLQQYQAGGCARHGILLCARSGRGILISRNTSCSFPIHKEGIFIGRNTSRIHTAYHIRNTEYSMTKNTQDMNYVCDRKTPKI